MLTPELCFPCSFHWAWLTSVPRHCSKTENLGVALVFLWLTLTGLSEASRANFNLGLLWVNLEHLGSNIPVDVRLPTPQKSCPGLPRPWCKPPQWLGNSLQGFAQEKAILIYLRQCVPEFNPFLPTRMIFAISANHPKHYLFNILIKILLLFKIRRKKKAKQTSGGNLYLVW